MKIVNKRFAWPIWPLAVIVVVSGMALPVISCRRVAQIEDGFCYTGLFLVSLRYLWGWKRGGYLVDLIVYLLLGLLMPIISISYVRLLSVFIQRFTE